VHLKVVITAVSLESGEWVRRFASTASFRRLSPTVGQASQRLL